MSRRRLVESVAWAATAAMVVLVLTQVLRIGQPFPLPIIQSLTPTLLLPALPLAMWANRRRRWALAYVNAAVTLALLGLLTPAVLGSGPPAAAPGATTVRVLGANVLSNNVEPERAAATLLSSGADVIGVSEYDPDLGSALDAAGGPRVYPYSTRAPSERGDGLALFSVFPFVSRDLVMAGHRPALRAVLDTGHGTLNVLVVHPLPPVAAEFRGYWAGDLAAIAELVAGFEGPTVVLGDFNASRWHPDFRRLLRDAGVRDAHDWLGEGLVSTWPADRFLPPFVHLDHVLVGGGVVPTAVGTERIPGSDHLAVTATLAVP